MQKSIDKNVKLYHRKCPITQLTDDSAKLLTTEDAPWLILLYICIAYMFDSYLPTCPYYQEFELQFLNITNNLCGEVSVGQIDVSEYKGKYNIFIY